MPSVLDAALSQTIHDAAFAYVKAGCSIVPLHGKRPTVKLKPFLLNRPNEHAIAYWLRNNYMHGIGVVAGAVSNNLVIIDFDSMDAVFEFEATFPELADTLIVRSGSGRGRHYYYYSTIVPFNCYHGGIELRASGAYVVAPPSQHPETLHAYRVINHHEPLRVRGLAAVRRWILDRGGSGPVAAQRRTPAPAAPAARSADAYGRAALAGECAAVRMAPHGQGNNTLFRAALKMGSLIASGRVSRAEVERELEAAAAALTARDGEAATKRTIKSGLDSGFRNGDTRRSAV